MKDIKSGDVVFIKSFSTGGDKNNKYPVVIYDTHDDHVKVLSCILHQGPELIDAVGVSPEDTVSRKLPRNYFINIDEIFLVDRTAIIEKVDAIKLNKLEEIFRKAVKKTAKKYYELMHKKQKEFIPGKSYIPYAGRVYNSEEIMTLVDSCLDFWLTAGRFTKQFEKEFSEFLGVNYCILTNSGSSANLLAVSALTSSKLKDKRLRPGNEVITTACAFPTTVGPIVQNKLIPVFIDVDVQTYNIQADMIEKSITPNTKAIFAAHTLGNPFDLDLIMSMASKYNLWVIEDNCDAVGSKYRNKYTGTFGNIATCSFYPPHHITMGEGGAVLTNDPLLKKIILSFRDWGRDCWCEPGCDNSCGKRFSLQLGKLPRGYDHKYIYSHLGYNLKITDMQAAVGVAQLKKLNRFITARKNNWNILYQGLKQHSDYFILPKALEHSDPSWFGFLLTVKENSSFSKNEIVKYLEDNKIATRMLFAGNIINHPAFKGVEYRIYGSLKNTDFIMNNTFWVGVYPGLNGDMLKYIIDKISNFIQCKENI